MILIGIDPGLRGGAFVWKQEEVLRGALPYQRITVPTVQRQRANGKVYTDYDVPAMAAELRALCPAGLKVEDVPRFFDAAIEASATRPGLSAGSVLQTGIGYGYWVGILTALGIPVRNVPSATWKKQLFQVSGTPLPAPVEKGMDPDERRRAVDRRKRLLKRSSCELARAMFPMAAEWFRRVSIDDGVAEAALIAFWLDQERQGAWAKGKKR